MMRERAARHQLRLVLDVDDTVDLVDADELRFKQVVLNLMSNAVKFTSDGGTVTVAAATEGPDVVVTVTDTGVGIAPEDRDRIFESFQQGPRLASTQEGTGLGLTLSRRIVELFGGRMWLESELGVGSTFGFSVPIGHPRLTDGISSTTPDALFQPLVIVIEDDERSLDLLTVYLESAGFEVLSARDGLSGLNVIRQRTPAAVVLDIRLPHLDGWDVLVALKADPETAPTPVLIVSMLDERARGLSLGAAEYLLKPVRRTELLSALARVGVRSAPIGDGVLAHGSEHR